MTKLKALRVTYLDASVAVKLVVPEEGESRKILNYFQANLCHMTVFCLHETLSALKTKWKRGESTKDVYLNRCFTLLNYVKSGKIELDTDANLADVGVFSQVEGITKQYGVDVSDALQVITIKQGKFRHFAEDSKAVLATADGDLVMCARSEGLKVWDFLSEELPN